MQQQSIACFVCGKPGARWHGATESYCDAVCANAPLTATETALLGGANDDTQTAAEILCGDCLYPIDKCYHGTQR